jgi:hypothetical protein
MLWGGGRGREGDCHAANRRSEGAFFQAVGCVGTLRTERAVSAGGTAKTVSKKGCADLDFCKVVATHSKEAVEAARESYRLERCGASEASVEPRGNVRARKSQVHAMNAREKLHLESAWPSITVIFLKTRYSSKLNHE